MTNQNLNGSMNMKAKLSAVLFGCAVAFAVSGTPVLNADEAKVTMTGEQVLETLKQGNERFVSGKRTYQHLDAKRVKELAGGQNPTVTIISCSDSRVPPEHVFDAGLGDIFTIRVAGNVCDTDEIGSIEYGVHHLNTPLLVVLGHSGCGAVTAVATKADVGGSIPALVDNIIPAVEKTQTEHPDLHGKELVPAAVKENVRQGIADLIAHSADTRHLVESSKLLIVGAVYNLEDGKVEWLGKHPHEKELLEKASH
jgi:carbonic anhydrase